jgi:hypothetical protein
VPTVVRRIVLIAGVFAAGGAAGYFTGKLVKESDLTAEQRYFTSKQRRCARKGA